MTRTQLYLQRVLPLIAAFMGIATFVLFVSVSIVHAAPAGTDPGGSTPVGSGRVFYVAANGDDSNAGTESAPWRSAGKAFSANLSPGDTVLFRRGDTFTVSSVSLKSSGSSGRPVTYGAYGTGARPIIKGFRGRVFDNGLSWVVFDRLHLNDGEAIRFFNASNIVLQNLEVSHYYRACINLGPPAHHITLHNNEVHDCGHGSNGKTKTQSGVNGEGIYIGENVVEKPAYVHDIVVTSNNVHHTTDEGISVKYTYHVRVEGNVVHDITTSDPGGISFRQVTNGERGLGHIIRNNEVYRIKSHPDKGGTGIGIITGEGVLVEGNLVVNNERAGINAYSRATVRNNQVCGNNPNISTTGSGHKLSNNTTTGCPAPTGGSSADSTPSDDTPTEPTACSRYLSGTPAPSPYALAWNWISSAKELLLTATCEGTATTATIGNANTNVPSSGAGLVYSWGKVYAYYNNSWNVNQPVSLTCNGTKIPVADATPTDTLPDYWCNGTLTGVLPANTSFFVGYTCIRTETAWKCGCPDASCIQSYWQLQGINRP